MNSTSVRHPEFDVTVLAALPALRRFAINLCKDAVRAEDLVSTTVVQAIAKHQSFEPGTNMAAWLFTILKNLHRSEYRKRKREVEDPDNKIAARVPVKESQYFRVLAGQITGRMRLLPKRQRDAVQMIMLGYEYEEIAARLHMPAGTVKSNVNRAREFLAGEEMPQADVARLPVGIVLREVTV